MMILGLTGSIGMGKSTAADNFRRLGIPVHDADKAVHELLAKNGEAAPRIKDLFSDTVNKGTLDRELIAKKVFADAQALARIEEILHPMVRRREQTFLGRAARQGRSQVVLDIPLLFETGGEVRCDAVVTVSAPKFIQQQRVLKRQGMTRERFDTILGRQIPDAEKRRRADFVVLTGLGRDFSLRQIFNLVRITSRWRGTKWPPRPDVRGKIIA